MARNWRCREGELDLVVRRGRILVFCEVKARTTDAFGVPAEAVTRAKQARIRRLAARWLAEAAPSGARDIRFDVVAVLGGRGRDPGGGLLSDVDDPSGAPEGDRARGRSAGTAGLDPATLAVVLGRPPDQPGAAVNPPVVLSSTFRPGGSATYGRDDNETRDAFEAVLGALEGGTALAFASGMAAIAAAVEAVPVGGRVIVAGDAYNGTRRLLHDAADRGRVSVRTTDVADTDATLEACAEVSRESARSPAAASPDTDGFASGGLLWLETPTNPLLAVADLASLTEGAHRLGLSVVVDNTFATPLLQRPLDLGADVVVHSVTKLLAGHSDVLMGAAVARSAALAEVLARRRSLHGAVPGPFDVFLALRGVRTLPVRLERAQANAAELAHRLVGRPGVSSVRYPGLTDHPGHQLARRQMSGFGTMVSFEVTAGKAAADAVCEAVRVLTPGTSLGGVETLIERRGRWAGESHLPPGLLRLSVGIEHVEDLWADLDRAIGAAVRLVPGQDAR